MPNRTSIRIRPRLERLENRLSPAVFNIPDGDVGALIAAVNAANVNNQPDIINLAANGTYTFAAAADPAEGGNALPTILRDGSDGNSLTINGQTSTLRRSTAAATPAFRFLRVGTAGFPVTVTLNELTLSNGDAGAGNGGAILLNAGNLAATLVTLTANRAAAGGAVYATGPNVAGRTLTFNDSAFIGNTASTGAGGAVNSLGPAAITLARTVFQANAAALNGGAVSAQTTGGISVNAGVLAQNTSNGGSGGGAICAVGPLSITDSNIRDNVSAGGGGGVWVQDSTGPGLSLTGSSVSGNRANGPTAAGGGLYVQGPLAVLNSTIDGNRAGKGGGLEFAGGGASGSISFSTVTDNRAFAAQAVGGGIDVAGGTLSVGNTAIAGNTLEAGGTGPDIAGAVNSLGYNLIGSTSGVTIGGTTTGNLSGVGPLLGPLQSNGGLTPTRMPLPGSPLANAGNPSMSAAPVTDQRGVGFPRVAGGRVDIGAAEVPLPRVQSVVVNGGAVQRSRLTELRITFNTAVAFSGGTAAGFTLTRDGGGAVGGFNAAATSAGGVTIVTLNNFIGAETQSGSLADGTYTLTVLANQVVSGAGQLDANGDGAGGDNYTAGNAQGLFRLYGDVNADRAVNGLDLAVFRTAFGTTTGNPNFATFLDVNGDGAINGLDLAEYRARFGRVLP